VYPKIVSQPIIPSRFSTTLSRVFSGMFILSSVNPFLRNSIDSSCDNLLVLMICIYLP